MLSLGLFHSRGALTKKVFIFSGVCFWGDIAFAFLVLMVIYDVFGLVISELLSSYVALVTNWPEVFFRCNDRQKASANVI